LVKQVTQKRRAGAPGVVLRRVPPDREARRVRIRLHESRHTALSLIEKADVKPSFIAAWAGHYSAAFTMATYVHANPEDLAAGRDALVSIYRAWESS
jgi:integrase